MNCWALFVQPNRSRKPFVGCCNFELEIIVMNIKKLGKKQKHYLRQLLYENRVIRVIRDYHEFTEEASVQDEEGDNDYETVSKPVLESLCKRKLLNVSSWLPALSVEIITFRIKSKCRAALLECIHK